MDREWGARKALEFVRRMDFPPSTRPSTQRSGVPTQKRTSRPRNGTRSWPHALGAHRLLPARPDTYLCEHQCICPARPGLRPAGWPGAPAPLQNEISLSVVAEKAMASA